MYVFVPNNYDGVNPFGIYLHIPGGSDVEKAPKNWQALIKKQAHLRVRLRYQQQVRNMDAYHA